jgi:hypothetical protein
MVRRKRNLQSLHLFIRTLIPWWRSILMTSSKPTYPTKPLPPHSLTLGIKTSICESGEYTNILPITLPAEKKIRKNMKI